MTSTKERKTPILNQFAGDILSGYIDRQRLPRKEAMVGYLIQTLPIDVKASPVALRKTVDGMRSDDFRQLTRGKELEKIPFDSLSLAIFQYILHHYTYEDRTISDLSTADWVSQGRSRLTKRQIEIWELDDNPQTSRVSSLRALGAREAICKESLIIDDQNGQGRYTLYMLNSGISALLRPGLEAYHTENGRYSRHEAVQYIQNMYPINQFETVWLNR